MGRGTGGRSGTRGPRKGRRLRAWIAPRASRLHGAVRRCQRLFHAPGEIFFFPGLQPLRQGTACRISGRSRGSIAAVPVARSVPGVSRLHGAVRRWRRLFHAPGKIFFPGLQPLRQGTACRVGGRSRGEHRGRARGAVCAACLSPSWRCSALAASFSRSGKTFSFFLGSSR